MGRTIFAMTGHRFIVIYNIDNRAFLSRDPKSPLRHVGVQMAYNDCTGEHEIRSVTCRLLLEGFQRKPRFDTRKKSECLEA